MLRPAPRIVSLTVALALLTGAASAQKCGAGLTLLKNDVLPDVPSGKYKFGVVPGLCKNEAAMSHFDYGTPCKVHAVSVLYGHAGGTNGVVAAVDVEIYDGANFGAGGKVTLGKLLFKMSRDVGSNLQIQSTAINTYTLPKPVAVSSGKPVIGFRMVLNNASGSCATGYKGNLSVDAAGTCKAGVNILDTTNYGTIDPSVYTVAGPIPIKMCPLFFNGSWVIRACVKPDVAVTWAGNATPGGVLSFTFHAPGQSGNGYYLVMSGGIKNGWRSPWGRLPLDYDWVFQCFLGNCAPALVGRSGKIGSTGKAFGGLLIPNLSVLKNSGFTMYAGFVTFKLPNFTPWASISAPSRAIVIN